MIRPSTIKQDHDSVIEWRDETPRRQGQSTEPSVFTARTVWLDITVLDSHLDCPGEWIMHCRALNIYKRPLEVATYEEARRKAWKVVAARLSKMQEDLSRIPYEGKA